MQSPYPTAVTQLRQTRTGRYGQSAEHLLKTAVLVGCCAIWSCSGEVRAPSEKQASGASAGTGTPTPTATGSNTAPTSPPMVPNPPGVTFNPSLDEDPASKCAGTAQPVAPYLKRLTNSEYVSSVRDLLNLTESEAAALRLLPEGTSNNAARLTVTSQHAGLFYDAAEQAAEMALSTPERRSQLVNCELAGSEDCVKELAGRLMWRGFRQNIEQKQRDDILTLSRAAINAADPDAYKPAKLVIQGVLNSPHFLYKKDTPNVSPLAAPPNASWKQLTSYSILERLSFLILGSLPDQAMIEQALTEQYDTPERVSSLARGMMNDPRAKEGVYRFMADWLSLPKVLSVPRNQADYPEWTPALAQAMLTEANRFLEDFYWAPNSNLLDMLSANYSYLNDGVAPLYQRASSGGAKVEFGANEPRGGLLTLPAILTLPVVGSETVAPILRGKFVRDVLLCSAPPLPGVMVPQPSADPNLSIREKLDMHRADPACKSCHELLDPVGYGLEQFDMIGQFQERGSRNELLIGKGRLYGLLGDPEFVGPRQLQELIKTSNATAACVVKHLQGYALARDYSQIDACTIAETFTSFKASNYDLKATIVDLVSRDSFRYIAAGGQ